VKTLVGILLMFAGLALGVYVGIWVCFVGGIVDIINQIKAPDMSASIIAWGVVKILFTGLAGWLAAAVCWIPGLALLND
jgi:hypothetical protein